jgi:hypothetical protein
MKGYASEVLIVSGAYLVSQNFWIGITVLCLGCLSALGRFSMGVANQKPKENLYAMLEKILGSLMETASEFENEKFKAKFQKTVH